MKLLPVIFALFFFTGDEIPFKPKEEFDLKLELQFKQRAVDRTKWKVGLEYEKTNNHAGPLPYLYLHLAILKQQPDEAKVKVVDNLGRTLTTKKIDTTKHVTLDLGFTDDLKDHVTPHRYEVLFMSVDKEVLRRILIEFESDGAYLVNREKRGKI